MVWRPLRILGGATGPRSRRKASATPDHRSHRLHALRPASRDRPGGW